MQKPRISDIYGENFGHLFIFIYLFPFTLKARGIKEGSGYNNTGQIQHSLDEYRLVRFLGKQFKLVRYEKVGDRQWWLLVREGGSILLKCGV